MSVRSTWRLSAVATVLATLGAGCHGWRTGRTGGLRPFTSERELARFIGGLSTYGPFGFDIPSASPTCSGGAAELLYRLDGSRGDGTAVVAGSVSDISGEGLAGVQVGVGDEGALTGPEGRFRLQLDSGQVGRSDSITVTATRIGYRPEDLQVPIERGDAVEISIRLCEEALALESVVVAAAEIAPPTSVTNVQHAGVDEGGIVKLHGDHLVILRRGRLFTVDIGGDRLEPVAAVDAFGPDVDPSDAWYDEMLISGEDLVVVGYSYGRGGTELGVFRVDSAGGVRHRGTYQLRSGDYFSSRNYASRLVDGKLVFYAPIWVDAGARVDAVLPALRRWGGGEPSFAPITAVDRVYLPGPSLAPEAWAVLHTVVLCDLDPDDLACSATSLLGAPGRVSYVSPTAAYIWVEPAREGAPSALYRLPLDGTPPTAIQVAGMPVDQFSFREEENGDLYVLVRGDAHGDGMWSAEQVDGDVFLLHVPKELFGDGRTAAPRRAYAPLPTPLEEDWAAFHNRFVGGHLLYGSGEGWWRTERKSGTSTLYVTRLADGALSALTLPHGVDRIEPMGLDAVVIGRGGDDLHFTGLDLGGMPSTRQRYVRREATQGELRSHGFFYRVDDAERGVLGLPVRGPSESGYAHLVDGSASILFLRNADGGFTELGALASRADVVDDDACVASCVDWYGNARPLFVGDRIFALLGYEIVEGGESAGSLREVRRVDLAVMARDVARR